MKNTRVNQIDLLRFLAAMMVVFFHYAFRGYAADEKSVLYYPLLAPTFKYGYLGVQLFFMISGFVILMTAAKGSVRNFIISRLVRLYPAFWVCCTITFLVILFAGAPRYVATFGQYLVNMTMFSGFVNVPSIDGAYWSLFVELRFYLLISIILIFGRIQQAQTFIIIWLISTIVLLIYPISILNSMLITDFAVFFIAGTTFFLIWANGLSITRITIIFVSWCIAVFQSIEGLRYFESHYKTSMNSFVVAAIITSFFAIMTFVSTSRTGFWSNKRWFVLGAITYPLYLIHQNIGFIIFNNNYANSNIHLLFWATIIGAISSAYLVNFLFERRFSIPLKSALYRFSDFLQFNFLKFYSENLEKFINPRSIEHSEDEDRKKTL